MPPLAQETTAPGPGRRHVRAAARERERERRKPLKVVGFAVAGVAIFGIFMFLGISLFSDDGSQAQALPDDTPAGQVSQSAVPDASAATALPTASTSGSPTPSPSPSKTSASPTPSKTVTHKPAPPPRKTADNPPAHTAGGSGSSLGPGDSGPAVVELQHRLAAMYLYKGPADGKYDQDVANSVTIYQAYRKVQGDPQGVYGPNTKAKLESDHPGQGGYGGYDGPKHSSHH